jgi:uncharacterized membrane protein
MRFELKPMSFGEVLDGAFKVFRSNLKLFLSIELLLALPSVLIQAWMRSAQAAMPNHALPPGYGPAMLVLLVFSLLRWGAANAAAVQAVTGEPTSLGKALSRYFSLFWVTTGASLLAGLIGGLWSLLFVIPGVVYYLRRSLYWPVLMVEGGTAVNALNRSKALVKGKNGKGRMDRIFGASMLFGVLTWVLIWGLGMLIPAGLSKTLIGTAVSLLPQMIIGPLFPISLVLIYFDARIRDEGYDLELRAKAAGAVVAPAAAPMSGMAGPAGTA